MRINVYSQELTAEVMMVVKPSNTGVAYHAARMENTMAAEDTQIGGTHYATKKVQPWHAMEAWMTRDQFAGFLRGNAIKYLARCDDKGGVEDLKKARHYLDKLIEFHECSNADIQRAP